MTGAPDLDVLRDQLLGRAVVAIGADVVEIDRIRRITNERPSFVRRVYTDGEQRYAMSARDSAERFAARFAAKEAGLKALGVGLGGADFVDLEVTKRPSGEPVLKVYGRAAARARMIGIDEWMLTLSHSDEVAYAVVVGLASPRP